MCGNLLPFIGQSHKCDLKRFEHLMKCKCYIHLGIFWSTILIGATKLSGVEIENRQEGNGVGLLSLIPASGC